VTYAEEFGRRLHTLIESLSDIFAPGERERLDRLADSNEAREALIILSEVIVQRSKRTYRTEIGELRALATGIVQPGDIPSALQLQLDGDSKA
jgi:hypothetical protein